jgi:hypothetical protein
MCLCERHHSGRELGLLPPPLAGEGWGGGNNEKLAACIAPSLSLPRKRGRGRCGAARRKANDVLCVVSHVEMQP